MSSRQQIQVLLHLRHVGYQLANIHPKTFQEYICFSSLLSYCAQPVYTLSEPLSSRDEVELVLGPGEGGEGGDNPEGCEGEGDPEDDGTGLGETAPRDDVGDEGPEPLRDEECDGDGDEVKKHVTSFLWFGGSIVRL
nr:MAG TPA: hypothetical protein [Caudoviricetes sp.]